MEKEIKDIQVKKNNLITMTKDSLTDYYKIIKLIGEGGHGKVYEVQNKKNLEYFACKKISKVNIIDNENFRNEICIFSNLNHPNIIKVYKIYESKRSYYIIMELCKGGPLFKKIEEKIQKNDFTAKNAAEIFKQIMSGIEYCHNQGIFHRDLKPGNILFLNEDNDNNNITKEKNNPLKIINFIYTKHFKINKLSSRIDSIYYFAPEVLAKSFNEKCDIWSAGVLLYLLLSGCLPFKGNNEKEIISKIKLCSYNMDNDIWKNISDEAKDLIKHMLIPEKERYNAKQVLNHPWFKIIDNIKDKKINIDIRLFKKYAEENNLKKTILYCLAKKLNEKEIAELKELFKKFDTNSDGQISLEEFEKGFLEYQDKSNLVNEKDIKNIFNMVDLNKNGKIDYSEFIAASLAGRKEIIERRLLDAFGAFDKTLTGKIKEEDFIKALNIDASLKDFANMVNDISKDGLIDYNEFLKLMNK